MNKYKILSFFLVISIIFSLAFTYPTTNTFPLFGKLIIIDPGHGGRDPGAISNGEFEKNYNLSFSKILKSVLENNGATVLLTREGDYDLSSPKSTERKRNDFNNRIKIINDSKADIYLSLHMNVIENTEYSGAQCFYSKMQKQNEKISNTIQKNLNNVLNKNIENKKMTRDYYMYDKLEVPGILIEYGFLSNYSDRTNLKNETYQKKIADAISIGIINYFT